MDNRRHRLTTLLASWPHRARDARRSPGTAAPRRLLACAEELLAAGRSTAQDRPTCGAITWP